MSDAKRRLKEALLKVLVAELETLEKAAQATREGATHEEAKPENDKDTRALEQSYLARGQALRLEELKTGITEVEAMPLRDFGPSAPVALGAIVVTEENEVERTFFLVPFGGGSKVADVQVVTPKSPIGQALLGKRSGDDCELVFAGKTRELSIVRVE